MDKEKIAEINSDFCVIEYKEQTDRFIRVVLKQKVNDFPHTLEYGLWVSLSQDSFEDYILNFDNNNHKTSYFGWLSNDLPDYDNSEMIPMSVYTKKGNERPEIVPHQDFEHQFIKDFYRGISKKEAERRIHAMLKNLE
ncbi:hypothetical protein GCM10022258_29330 [Aquimarina gracilis]